MKRIDWKELGLDILVDIAAGLLIAIGVYNFALNADFPVAGFSGIASSAEYPGRCRYCDPEYSGGDFLL